MGPTSTVVWPTPESDASFREESEQQPARVSSSVVAQAASKENLLASVARTGIHF